MLDSIQHIVYELGPLLNKYGYFILALTIAIEGCGIPAPGQSFLIVSVVLALAGQMSLTIIIIVAAISAFSGNLMGYLIGIKFGDVLITKNWIKPKTEQKLQSFINRYGIAALLMSRFIEGLKQYLSIGCGIAKMPLRKFIFGNGLATVIWVAIFVAGPMLIQSQYKNIVALYQQHEYMAYGLLALIAIMLVLFCRSRFLRKTKKVQS